MVKISEAAAKKIKEDISKHENPQNTVLRIVYKGFG